MLRHDQKGLYKSVFFRLLQFAPEYASLFFIECDNGTYGKECKASCGHCFNQEPCYHINGTCFTGCESGYLGDLCQSRM